MKQKIIKTSNIELVNIINELDIFMYLAGQLWLQAFFACYIVFLLAFFACLLACYVQLIHVGQ